jgi:hypothetical protein
MQDADNSTPVARRGRKARSLNETVRLPKLLLRVPSRSFEHICSEACGFFSPTFIGGFATLTFEYLPGSMTPRAILLSIAVCGQCACSTEPRGAVPEPRAHGESALTDSLASLMKSFATHPDPYAVGQAMLCVEREIIDRLGEVEGTRRIRLTQGKVEGAYTAAERAAYRKADRLLHGHTFSTADCDTASTALHRDL